jgi:transcription-repair coupling factor (superfamily II helicase)
MDLLGLFAAAPPLVRIAEQARGARRAVALGSVGSSAVYTAGALGRLLGAPVLYVVAHVDEADEAVDQLDAQGLRVRLFPALESLPGESAVSVDLLAERLGVLAACAKPGEFPDVLVAPIHALMQSVPAMSALGRVLRTLRVGETPEGGVTGLVRWLQDAGYTRTEAVEEPGEFASRGGILDIFPPGSGQTLGQGSEAVALGGAPVRVEFFGDQIDRINEFDLDTMGGDRALRGVQLVCATPDALPKAAQPTSLIDALPPGCVAVLHELMELTEQGRGYYERCADAREIFGPPAVFKRLRERLSATVEINQVLPYGAGQEAAPVDLGLAPAPALPEETGLAVAELARIAQSPGGEGAEVCVLCQNDAERQRLGELVAQFAPGAGSAIGSATAYMAGGFVVRSDDPRRRARLLLPYHELLQRFQARRTGRARRLRAGRAMDTFLEIQPGDYVVHTEHGIARYLGLKLMRPRDATASLAQRQAREDEQAPRPGEDAEEYLTLEFDGGVKLHVPAVKCALVQKYVGGFKGRPPLSTLGGQRWRNQKDRVAESVRDLASEMLRLRAAREHLPGIRFPGDTAWQKEFEDEFPHEETEDQLAALAEIKRDMQSPRPMDRLLCGDVGFGKTELAVRAAFKACEHGKQAAVLVPTTVLAEQHERTFAARFKDYPFKVASVSRFKSDAEVREVLRELAAGRLDVIIGTHRLLSKDVRFADLGLVVIDEEQRFGVEHKDKLLSLRMTADILTLSATPIPRTLHLSMLGLRDISSLTTPPADRRAVVTEIIPPNPARLKQIIERELAREGQVYYVHNRVSDIQTVADDVQRLAPGARIVVGHGQMGDGELEQVMLRFMRRQADILVSTTIIESGIDNPHANTMIICDADRFGLADLHQLRGRVGRYKHRAYCYLLLPEKRPVKDVALKRLKAVEQFSMLGAGFKIAMRDLEIRGAGNILGPEQSGHIAAVGYDMYCQLLDRAVKDLRNETVAAPTETGIEIGVRGLIPRPYIPSDQRRLEAYRRLSLAASFAELDKLRSDLLEAYGKPPEPVVKLLDLAELRIAARALGVRSVSVRAPDVILATDNPGAVLEKLEGVKGSVRSVPPLREGGLPEIYFRPVSGNALEPATLLLILRKRLKGEPAKSGPADPPGRSAQGPASGAGPGGLTRPRGRA